MFQRISLYWQLSVLSPVSIANSSGSPVTGPFLTALIGAHHRVADLGGEHLLRPVGRREDPGTWPVALGSS